MKKIEIKEMHGISGGFRWADFAKGICEGIVIGALFSTSPPVAVFRGSAIAGAACQFID